ncbi:hypothetical protein V5799_020125 [Amblyomma americanum]|uniref:Secreted protein n=1 Tax=Amblyomma americanum TaxID=6943 RepID=A0AAQ4EUN0_AMBAM
MKFLAVCLLLGAALHVAQSMFLGSLLLALPFGPIVATNGILGFKVAMGAALLSALGRRGLGGHYGFHVRAGSGIGDDQRPAGQLGERRGLLLPAPSVMTTEQPEPTVHMPISALRDLLRVERPHHEMDVMFTFLKEIDDHDCVSRMVCESAADALRLGKVGNATVHFFADNTGLKTGPGAVFVSAAQTGRAQGLHGCATAFPKCAADLPHILSMAGLM